MTPALSPPYRRHLAMVMLFELAWSAEMHDPDRRHRLLYTAGRALAMLTVPQVEIGRALDVIMARHPHPKSQSTDPQPQDQEMTHAT